MAHFLSWMPQIDYGRQWAVSFGAGCFTWFLIICFAKILPAPLQLITFLIPICCFLTALSVLSRWQRQGRRDELIDSLQERERSHALMNRHHFNLASMDMEHHQAMQALRGMFPDEEEEDPSMRGVTPHAQLSPPDQAVYLLRVKQDVMQACGDIGWLCVEYMSGQGSQYFDKEGWITVEKLRSNWGKKYSLNTEQLRQLLTALTHIQTGEWRDSSLKEWRLLLTV